MRLFKESLAYFEAILEYMDNLGDILGRMDFREPEEVKLIKNYVKTEFKSDVTVSIRERDGVIVIHAPNAALAVTLRLHGPQIKHLLKTDKRLVFQGL